MALTLESLKEFTRKQWKYLLQIGAWIMLILGSFVLPPPIWDFREDSVWFHFTHFVVSALVGLIFVPMVSCSGREHRWLWWRVTIALLVVGIGLFFSYMSLRASWTAPYNASRIVIGSTYKQDALDYKEQIRNTQHREITDAELIMDYVGNTSSLWDDAEMRQRSLIFAGVYMAVMSIFALTILTLIQALYCSSRTEETLTAPAERLAT